jgi:AAA+ ATPase superfamily predicted ATPase
MAFVNRVDELAALQAWWERPNARPALVWGRRRVGKTALLQHFAAATNAPVVFHTGTGETAAAEIATLSRQIAAVLPDRMRDLATQPYGTWRDILDHLARAARDSRVLLVLDEFPELIGSSPALPGILRAFLDDVRALGEGIVAVGPWWSDDSKQEIDAVVLAQREHPDGDSY